jgi:hypothetical protein
METRERVIGKGAHTVDHRFSDRPKFRVAQIKTFYLGDKNKQLPLIEAEA